jgi:hypothetical protein
MAMYIGMWTVAYVVVSGYTDNPLTMEPNSYPAKRQFNVFSTKVQSRQPYHDRLPNEREELCDQPKNEKTVVVLSNTASDPWAMMIF